MAKYNIKTDKIQIPIKDQRGVFDFFLNVLY